MRTDRTIKIADLRRSTFKAENNVWWIGGVCPTILARDAKGPLKIMEESADEDKERERGMDGSR